MISDADRRLLDALQFLAVAATDGVDHPPKEHEETIGIIRTWVRAEARDEARKFFNGLRDNEDMP